MGALPAISGLLATPAPEARRAVGQMSAVLLVLALLGLVVLCALVLIYLRRRARLRAELARLRQQPTSQTDAWEESSRRIALEDGRGIPREPGTE